MKYRSPLLSARGITKIYPGGVVANDSVDLDVYAGEVLALLGENGAGKTTLVSILSGHLRPTRGRILVQGEPVEFRSPRDAVRMGIVLVPQHPKLVESYTVAENVGLFLAYAGRKMSVRAVKKLVESLSKAYGLPVDPEAPVYKLSLGERQRVELLKALSVDPKVLLLDEPTTHLTPFEAERLLDLARRLASEGKCVVLITHKLREALRASDRIVVMRKGRVVAELSREEASEELLVKYMFESVPERKPAGPHAHEASLGPALLEVEDLWVRGEKGEYAVRGVTLHVRSGEIVGVAGVAGNGQLELFEALVGLRKPCRGTIRIAGTDVTAKGARERALLGVAVIPEERLGWGAAPGKSLAFNAALGAYLHRNVVGRVLVSWRKVREYASKIVEAFGVQAPTVDAPIDSLSGGNIQKFVVGRELTKQPRLVLAMNPTWGLDYEASRRVRSLLLASARRGAGVLMISEDLEELVELCDRIAVMSRGRIAGVFTRPFTISALARAMTS